MSQCCNGTCVSSGLSWCLLLVVGPCRGVFFSECVCFSWCLILVVGPCGVSHEASDLFPSVTQPRYHGSHRRRIDDVSVSLSVLVFVSSFRVCFVPARCSRGRLPRPLALRRAARRDARARQARRELRRLRGFVTVTRCRSEDSPTLTRTHCTSSQPGSTSCGGSARARPSPNCPRPRPRTTAP